MTFWTKEPETLYWISDFQTHDVVFWDIGANIGCYSLFCAHAHPWSKTFAFEPHSVNFLRLMANVHNNDFGRLISPQFMALSDRDGRAEFHMQSKEAGSSGSQIEPIKAAGKYSIQVMTGDTIAQMSGINPTHVKIDVDGDEYKILQGMAGVLPNVNSILVEANSPDVIEYLKDFGFEPDKKYMALRGAGWKRTSNTNVIFNQQHGCGF
jgi:FkbM family methyltransferase